MGDEAADPRPGREGGEKSAGEVADDALEDGAGQGEDFEVRLGDQAVPKWIRPAMWGAAPFVLVVLYLFALPVLIIFLESKDLLSHGGPKWYAFLEAALSPISWLYENVELYQRYLDWFQQSLA